MLGRTALRFTLEAAVIIAVAVGIALDNPSWSKVIAVMAPVYVIVAGFEWLVSRGRRSREAAAPPSGVASSESPSPPDAESAREGTGGVSVLRPESGRGEEPPPAAREPAGREAGVAEPGQEAEVEPSEPPPVPASEPTPATQPPPAFQPEPPPAFQPEPPPALQPEPPPAFQAEPPSALQPEPPEAPQPEPRGEPPPALEPQPRRETEQRPQPEREVEPAATVQASPELRPSAQPEPETEQQPERERPPLVAAPALPPEPEPAPEPEQPAAPAERDVVPLVQRGPRAWNIWELERLSREHAGSDSVRDEERAYLLVYLREFAGADGLLPVDFDGLVRESFGDLVGTG